MQVRQRETGHGAGSVSALRPLRAAILELLQLRRRAGLHALSQVPSCVGMDLVQHAARMRMLTLAILQSLKFRCHPMLVVWSFLQEAR